MASEGWQAFHSACTDAVNQMLTLKLHASYVDLSVSTAFHFDCDYVVLSHMVPFLKDQSYKVMEHVEKFLKYQNKRGDHIMLEDVKKPEKDDWVSSWEVLELERSVNQTLEDLYRLATDKGAPPLCDFLKSEFLDEQVEAIKCLADFLSNLKCLGVTLYIMGEYLLDKPALEERS
ncbi:hypothetical protein lerEdw1_002795 [Lerista edwardsae]|nr:hypothetical protein lerEdw1_002795 [Lerista edwardsae]